MVPIMVRIMVRMEGIPHVWELKGEDILVCVYSGGSGFLGVVGQNSNNLAYMSTVLVNKMVIYTMKYVLLLQ